MSSARRRAAEVRFSDADAGASGLDAAAVALMDLSSGESVRIVQLKRFARRAAALSAATTASKDAELPVPVVLADREDFVLVFEPRTTTFFIHIFDIPDSERGMLPLFSHLFAGKFALTSFALVVDVRECTCIDKSRAIRTLAFLLLHGPMTQATVRKVAFVTSDPSQKAIGELMFQFRKPLKPTVFVQGARGRLDNPACAGQVGEFLLAEETEWKPDEEDDGDEGFTLVHHKGGAADAESCEAQAVENLVVLGIATTFVAALTVGASIPGCVPFRWWEDNDDDEEEAGGAAIE